jgi:hypothetical protein
MFVTPPPPFLIPCGDLQYTTALYPIVMTLVNLVITVGDIRISTSDVDSKSDYYLYIAYYALYGSRGIFYAIMAIIDPSLIRAIRVWRGIHNSSTGSSFGNSISVHTETTRSEFEMNSPINLAPNAKVLQVKAFGPETRVEDGAETEGDVESEGDEEGELEARHPHWTESDISVESRIMTVEDMSSMADLTQPSLTPSDQRIQEIREQQMERARRKHQTAKQFKRQI